LAPAAFGLLGASPENLWTHGGVFPTGPWAFLKVIPLALASFAGVEVIGLAAGETRDAARTLPRAVNGLILRMCIFYVGPMIIIMSIVPWTQIPPGTSPFVLALQISGVPGVAAIMNVLLISAFASSGNSFLFGNMRALRSLAVAGLAPASLGELNSHGVPGRAAGVSTGAILVTILLNYFIPGRALGLLLSATVVQVVVTWAVFVLAHLQFRRRRPCDATSPFRTPLPTWCNYGALGICAAVVVVLSCDAQFRSAVVFSGVFFGALALTARIRLRRVRALTPKASSETRQECQR
jgi:L-asparagine transporter-like permease